jgi:hypothetical protein
MSGSNVKVTLPHVKGDAGGLVALYRRVVKAGFTDIIYYTFTNYLF